jgi:hypothetical protein
MADKRKNTNIKVVSINDKPNRIDDAIAAADEKRKIEMFAILKKLEQEINEGKIKEFSATSLDKDGEAKIHCYVDNVAVGVGLFEIGKNILINQYDPYDKDE